MTRKRCFMIILDNDESVHIECIKNIIVVNDEGETFNASLIDSDEPFEIDLSHQLDFSLFDTGNGTLNDPEKYLEITDGIVDVVKEMSLNLSYCHLKDTQLHLILECLKDQRLEAMRKKLACIDISHNYIDTDGFKELFEFIKTYCPNFKTLKANINGLRNDWKRTLDIPECIRDTFTYCGY